MAARTSVWHQVLILLCFSVAFGRLDGNCQAQSSESPSKTSGNPIFPGWYADPEGAVFGKRFWVFPTYSAPYNQQTFFDAFSSPDLVHWTKHDHILGTNTVSWARRAMWAPSVVEKGGQYYFFFGANDIQNDQQK